MEDEAKIPLSTRENGKKKDDTVDEPKSFNQKSVEFKEAKVRQSSHATKPGAVAVKPTDSGKQDPVASKSQRQNDDGPQVFDVSHNNETGAATTSRSRSEDRDTRIQRKLQEMDGNSPTKSKVIAASGKTTSMSNHNIDSANSEEYSSGPLVFDTASATPSIQSTSREDRIQRKLQEMDGNSSSKSGAVAAPKKSTRMGNTSVSSATWEPRSSGPQVFDTASATASVQGDNREDRIQRKLAEMDGTSSAKPGAFDSSTDDRTTTKATLGASIRSSNISSNSDQRRLSGPQVFDTASATMSMQNETRENRIQRKLNEMDSDLRSNSKRPSAGLRSPQDYSTGNVYDDDRENRIQRKLDEMIDDDFGGSIDVVAKADKDFEYSDELGARCATGAPTSDKELETNYSSNKRPGYSGGGETSFNSLDGKSVLNAPVIIATGDPNYSNDDGAVPDDEGKGKNKKILVIGIVIAVVIIVIVVAVVFSVSGGGDGGKVDATVSPTSSSTPAPTLASTTPPPTQDFSVCFDSTEGSTSDRYLTIRNIIEKNSNVVDNDESYFDYFDDPGSPQRMALCWIAEYDGLKLESSQFSTSQAYENAVLERYTAALLNYAFVGRDELISSNWLTAVPECEWDGATCTFAPSLRTSISNLSLSEKALSGPIPPEIIDLSELTYLNIENNGVSGTIPDNIWYMPTLEVLNIAKNPIIGTLSTEIGLLVHLVELIIDNTNLVGSIPEEIGKLTKLEILDFLQGDSAVATGGFNGTLPVSIGLLTKLVDLSGGDNKLTGSIPNEIQSLTDLMGFDLRRNSLSGTISTGIGLLTNLEGFFIQENKFNGTLPSEMGNLQLLLSLNVEWNALTGTVPLELGRLTNLEELILHGNNFEPPFPDVICDLKVPEGNLSSLIVDCDKVEVYYPCVTDCL